MIGPDFVGIGVQRGGTSWLYQCFKEHPQIFMPGKEIHFFDQQYDKGIDWYASLFDIKDTALVKGEMTPDYLFDKDAIVKLHSHFPNAKLIVILRDPFERAYSAVSLLKSHGRYKNKSFSDVIEKNNWIIQQSLYFEQLEHLFSMYPMEQVKIYFFEDITDRPLWLLENVFKFIGVEIKFEPTIFADKFNVSTNSAFVNSINLEKLQTKLKGSKFGREILKLKRLKIIKSIKNKFLTSSAEENLKFVHFSEELRTEIRNNIIKVEKLLDLNLKRWY